MKPILCILSAFIVSGCASIHTETRVDELFIRNEQLRRDMRYGDREIMKYIKENVENDVADWQAEAGQRGFALEQKEKEIEALKWRLEQCESSKD